jgi:F0F1-type ATP synthase membrane subunit b/b'
MGERTEEQLTREIEGTREDLSRNLDALNDKVNPSRVMERRKRAVRNKLGSMKDKVMGTADNMRTSAQDAGGSVTDRASNLADSATSTAADAARSVQQRAEGNPLAAGLIAFGAGALIASLIPASEKESQAAQKLVETAKEQGQPIVEEAKSVGQEMGQELKDKAAEAGQEIKASAQESMEHVKQEGQSSARDVKDDTRARMQ